MIPPQGLDRLLFYQGNLALGAGVVGAETPALGVTVALQPLAGDGAASSTRRMGSPVALATWMEATVPLQAVLAFLSPIISRTLPRNR